MTSERIEALRQALQQAPENSALRLILADLLREAGRIAEAAEEYGLLARAGQLPPSDLVAAGETALQAGNLELAAFCLSKALEAGAVAGTAGLQAGLDAAYAQQGMIRVVLPAGPAGGSSGAAPSLEMQQPVAFAGVGGLDEVKKAIHRLIILPFLRPDLYQRYGRQAGGGLMLYGPPGCGKTMLARATAGECQLPFFNVRIEHILDPYHGVSEQNLHQAFAAARAQAPCVLFLDELDALAYTRRKQGSNPGRTLVDQLLQEMDAIGAENSRLLVMGATNEPWDVDDALLRPGRFDRRVFVPPPDEEARRQILSLYLARVPVSSLDPDVLAAGTSLFSGADLRALVEGAVDRVIDEALSTSSELPVTMRHLQAAQAGLHPTTVDWLARARNYVEFANEDGRYDDLARFLAQPRLQAPSTASGGKRPWWRRRPREDATF